MITLKELGVMILAIIILAFSRAFINLPLFIISLIFFAIIVLVYVFSKKAMAYYLDSKEETKIWTFQRYGLRERSHFSMPIPFGIIIPFVLSILSLGLIPWYAVLESEVSTTTARTVRRHDYYSFAELTEWHIGLISAAGIFTCFILSFIAYLFNFPDLSKLAIYFACFNLIPLGKLDGTRIFFGSKILYAIMLVLAAIGLIYALAL